MPSAKSHAEVRAFNAKALELNAYCRRADVAADRRSLYRVEPPRALRSATDAEIAEIAKALDAGALIVPRLWNERFYEGSEVTAAPVQYQPRVEGAAQIGRAA
jgi:hypothetical protein